MSDGLHRLRAQGRLRRRKDGMFARHRRGAGAPLPDAPLGRARRGGGVRRRAGGGGGRRAGGARWRRGSRPRPSTGRATPEETCDYVYVLCLGRTPSLLELREGRWTPAPRRAARDRRGPVDRALPAGRALDAGALRGGAAGRRHRRDPPTSGRNAHAPDWFAAGGYIQADYNKPGVPWDLLEATDDGYDLYGDGVIRMWQTPGHAPGHQSFEITLPNTRLGPADRRRGLHDRPLGGEGAARLPRLGRRHGPLGPQAPPHRGALGIDRGHRPRPRRVGELQARPRVLRLSTPPALETPHRRSLRPSRAGRSRRSGRRSSTDGSRRASATRWRSWPSASASPAPRCGRRCSCSSARASCASSATAASACWRRRRTTSRRSSRCACCSRSRRRGAPARC